MNASFYRDLLVNALIVLIASILFTFVNGVYKNKKHTAEVIIGTIAGIAGTLILTTTVHYSNGIVFDTRSILVSTIGMFFGWLPTAIAAAFIIVTRIIIGGGGTFTGILVTVVTAAIGLCWRKLRIEDKQQVTYFNTRYSTLEFYLVGLFTHLVMLVCLLTLPGNEMPAAIASVSLPILLIYPTISLLICMILCSRLRQAQADTELLLSESKFRTLYEQAPIGVAFMDQHGEIHSNQMAAQILGSPLDAIPHHEWPITIDVSQFPHYIKTYEAFVNGLTASFQMERFYTKPNGTNVWIRLTLAPLNTPDMFTKCNIWLMEDVTVHKQKEAEVLQLTYHDALTGMFNRAFIEKERQRLDSKENLPLSVILGDVNGLKLVNDAFGHEEGDYLLKEVTKILKNCLRDQDIIARIGGDEFLILLPQTDAIAVQRICDSIYSAYQNRTGQAGHELFEISISLGYATKVTENESLDTIINTAERYMYRRKLTAHKHLYQSVLQSIRSTLYDISNETPSHGERMAELAKSIATVLGLSNEEKESLELAAVLHDIGKVRVDLNILKKNGALTQAEWEEMKKHPETGYRIAQSIPYLNAIAEVILYHHERWDGTGYPHGLSGENIPLLARILTLVDAYDTMLEDRSYRKALKDAQAIKEILTAAGKQFDPELAHLFVEKVLGINISNAPDSDSTRSYIEGAANENSCSGRLYPQPR